MFDELMLQLQPIIISACITILTAVATYIGTQIKNVVIEKVNTEQKKKIVETTCKAINQLYKDLDGPTKFEKAKENILEQLNDKGIKITELELQMLIECTVNGFKDGMNTTPTKPEEPDKNLKILQNSYIGR